LWLYTVENQSDEAEKITGTYSETMRRRAAEESAARTGLSAIYARSAEHEIKLGLAAHEGDTIGVEAMRWGITVADFCAAYMAEAVKANFAENEYERSLNAVLMAIRDGKGEWLDSRTLINRTRNMKFRDRNEIIASLIEMGEVERGEVETATKKAFWYRSVR